MKPTLKICTLFSCTVYTLCASETLEEKMLTAPPSSPVTEVTTPIGATGQKTPQFPDLESLSVSPAVIPTAPPNSQEALSLSPHPLATSAQKDAIREFIKGFSTVMSKINDAHGQNVHALDPFMLAHIPTHLLKTLQELKIGDNALTKEAIITQLKAKAPIELRYENTKIPKSTIHNYIDQCVNLAFTQPQTQELFSRYVTVLIDMDDQDYYNTLLNSITENYTTGGGCWPGVRNRCAISFAYLVAHRIDAF